MKPTKAQIARLAYQLSQYAVHTRKCLDQPTRFKNWECTCGLTRVEAQLWEVVSFKGKFKP